MSSSPTTAGISSERATMAVCEVFPPMSMAKPSTHSLRIWAVSDGERSRARTMTPSGICVIRSWVAPTRLCSRRWPMSSMSPAFSRR